MKTPVRLLVLGAVFIAGIGAVSFSLAWPLPPIPRHYKVSELVDSTFRGTYRSAVKTSAFRSAEGDIVIDMEPKTLGAFLNSLNEGKMTDKNMRRAYKWGDKTAPPSRIAEEMHNVRVRGWLWAIKSERLVVSENGAKGDNDFHVLIANYGYRRKELRFLSVEVSGLPDKKGADYSTVHNTRRQLVQLLDSVDLKDGKFTVLGQPIHVEVEGSLFFDGKHDETGPQTMESKTPWEIHPVTSIKKVSTP